MYRFSRAIFVEVKDLVDPHPDTVSAQEARRRVLQCCEATIERLARDPHYFAKPSQSLFQELRHYFSISDQARVFRSIDRHIGKAVEHSLEEIDRANEGMASCKATTRKGKPCQRTPLPDREYCPSHQHLAARTHVTAYRRRGSANRTRNSCWCSWNPDTPTPTRRSAPGRCSSARSSSMQASSPIWSASSVPTASECERVTIEKSG